jgi:hypothetical protein
MNKSLAAVSGLGFMARYLQCTCFVYADLPRDLPTARVAHAWRRGSRLAGESTEGRVEVRV